VKWYPAIDLSPADPDLVSLALDDAGAIAIEERDGVMRAFFSTPTARDAALATLSGPFIASSIDVPDEDWARRSQENLQPVTVGRLTIVPRHTDRAARGQIAITIPPSMGFGTGHHATTRLCLAALQDIDVHGKTVLDVGTGSGVLAIAAARLGASKAIGIDFDPDAIQSANESLEANPDAVNVTFEVADLGTRALAKADVVTANLTGALLERSAGLLWDAIRSGGTLILSGVMATERDAVVRAFRAGTVVWERHDDEWVGLAVKKS
jgi:ribosomal protein L11 methyltransferase